MGWKKDLEHLRDWGKTWGPGVDDARTLTEDEMAGQDALAEAYRRKLGEYSVAPREAFVKFGKQLREAIPGGERWQEEYRKAKIELCRAACDTLGYSLELGWEAKARADQDCEKAFSVSVEYCGWLPGRGGNIHNYFVCGIQDAEDCLQLVADFQAIGVIPTTWYGKDFHYSTGNTGELRYELIRRFGIGFPESRGQVDKLIAGAVQRSGFSDADGVAVMRDSSLVARDGADK